MNRARLSIKLHRFLVAFLTMFIGVEIGLIGSAAWATAMLGTVQLSYTDGAGRTRQATAQLISMAYTGNAGNSVLAVSYYTDQLFCSAFGGAP